MKDEEIVRHFDGRGRVDVRPGVVYAAQERRIGEIAHALGYRLLSRIDLRRGRVLLHYERDDAPQARRRAQLSIARLRAGHPLLPVTEVPPPPPPPPAPAPPLTPRQPQSLPRRSPEPPPPAHRPRIPPRPVIPPPPPIPPAPPSDNCPAPD